MLNSYLCALMMISCKLMKFCDKMFLLFFFFKKRNFVQVTSLHLTSLSPSLSSGHSVGSHTGVVSAVTPGRPQEQSSGHQLQREGDEGEVQGPAQRALHPVWWWVMPVEQIQTGQETADSSQRAQAWWAEAKSIKTTCQFWQWAVTKTTNSFQIPRLIIY